MAKKPVRYPKKLRMKLEKIADTRDQRKPAEVPAAPELDPVMRTLWWEFYPERSIVLMNARIDEARQKLITENYLSPPAHLEAMLYTTPPWLDHESDVPD